VDRISPGHDAVTLHSLFVSRWSIGGLKGSRSVALADVEVSGHPRRPVVSPETSSTGSRPSDPPDSDKIPPNLNTLTLVPRSCPSPPDWRGPRTLDLPVPRISGAWRDGPVVSRETWSTTRSGLSSQLGLRSAGSRVRDPAAFTDVGTSEGRPTWFHVKRRSTMDFRAVKPARPAHGPGTSIRWLLALDQRA
jgi:hypothetical protein